ncbi:MAG: hypothetical protein Q8Q45_04055 [Methylococcaceae bacterium]|nr:hypothetical protein [Methylococcaceae bacterium]MDP3389433.1 hypothetical protein [Methylococcaceae bacterium]MDP3931504.1 hypothetical protein [Methylococcaceae bacterium]
MVTGVGFCEQVACGVVNVFGDDSVPGGPDAVADAIVDIAAGALADEAVGDVEGVGGAALGKELAFLVVAECGAVLAG